MLAKTEPRIVSWANLTVVGTRMYALDVDLFDVFFVWLSCLYPKVTARVIAKFYCG